MVERFNWTAERIAELTKLWLDGNSQRLIAEHFGEGLTKSAIAGKINRLGLQRDSYYPTKSFPRLGRVSKPANKEYQKTGVLIPEPEIVTEGVSNEKYSFPLMKLTSKTCRWPFSDVGEPDFHFCMKAKDPLLPYCKKHIAMAWVKPVDRGVRKRWR